MHRRLVYIYLLNVPSFSSLFFQQNKTNVSFREIARLIARNSLLQKLNYAKIKFFLLLSKTSVLFQSCVKISDQYIEYHTNYSLFNLKESKLKVTKIGICAQVCFNTVGIFHYFICHA